MPQLNLSDLAFGVFVLALLFRQWKPGSEGARWVHYGIWMVLGAGAGIGILGGLFTLFWPPALYGALVWSCATVGVLLWIAASNRAPPY